MAEDPVVLLERNPCGHPFAGLLLERQFEKVQFFWKTDGQKFQIGNAHSLKERVSIILVCVCGMAGKKQNLDPMWKILSKDVDLGAPTSFFDHVYLDCTQRECDMSKDIVDSHRTMFESIISAGATEKLPYSENIRISSWSYDMEGHAKKCVERYYNSTVPFLDDHHSKKKN